MEIIMWIIGFLLSEEFIMTMTQSAIWMLFLTQLQRNNPGRYF